MNYSILCCLHEVWYFQTSYCLIRFVYFRCYLLVKIIVDRVQKSDFLLQIKFGIIERIVKSVKLLSFLVGCRNCIKGKTGYTHDTIDKYRMDIAVE